MTLLIVRSHPEREGRRKRGNEEVRELRGEPCSGELKAQKVGNTWYITDKTLTEFITGEKPEKR